MKDDLGLSKLADKYERLLIHIASGILGSRQQDIEECINDTYLKLWKNIHKYDMKKASLKTYLKVIVRNTAINKLRDLSKREEIESGDDLSDIAKYYVDQGQNLERNVFNKESIQLLNEIIRGLKKKDQELVIRKYFYLQNSKKIASSMSMSVTAVDSRLSRLRTKMKQEFDQENANVWGDSVRRTAFSLSEGKARLYHE